MRMSEEDYLAHYGTLRKSGRYPWGSGEDAHQSNRDFLDYVADLRKKGLSEAVIAEGLKISVNELRAGKSIALQQQRSANLAMVERLKAKGMSNVAIAERMGFKGESNVRALLESGDKVRADVLQTTASMLQRQVDSKGFIDVGLGVERQLGIADTQLKAAVVVAQEKGYEVHVVKFPQLGTGKETAVKVLCPPGTKWQDVKNNMDKIRQIQEYSLDGGKSYTAIKEPLSVDSKRIQVKYKDEGGANADGVIYVRPGVDDLSLGDNRYAQVRVAVDGTHFLKGMAIYKDDLPPGVDLVFNTNKERTGNKLDAMKPLNLDEKPDSPTYNPFGSFVKQLPKLDADGNPIEGSVRSAMNLVNEAGDWEKWNDTLSSQMLSKQNISLAKNQLDITYQNRKADLDDIRALTNPAIRKKLLIDYADEADAAAVHLKAVGMRGQGTHVILPINSLKDNEIHAPNYTPGERVVLIRFPHGGTFEIPELTVTNKNAEANKLLGKAVDAVGINARVAERLSGADFDGDTVLVIPNNSGRIKTRAALEGLKNFDAKAMYKLPPDAPKMTEKQKGIEMGRVSNLITDMTIGGATTREIAAAVRHSMVVIDARNHHLNYKQSERDNNIPSLIAKYQKRKNGGAGGASTVISRSNKSTIDVPERKQGYRIDPITGKKIYRETGNSYINSKGKLVYKTQKSPKILEVDDVNELSSGTPIEKVYADYANSVKALANKARLEVLATPSQEYNPSAKKTYAKEVRELDEALHEALLNAPRERHAQILANANYRAKTRANPDMDDAEKKKLRNLALLEARNRVGAKKPLIVLSDSQWAAIQAGAVSQKKLSDILNNTDMDKVKERATPRVRVLMSPAKKQRAISLQNSGATIAEIAAALGVSTSTIKRELSS